MKQTKCFVFIMLASSIAFAGENPTLRTFTDDIDRQIQGLVNVQQARPTVDDVTGFVEEKNLGAPLNAVKMQITFQTLAKTIKERLLAILKSREVTDIVATARLSTHVQAYITKLEQFNPQMINNAEELQATLMSITHQSDKPETLVDLALGRLCYPPLLVLLAKINVGQSAHTVRQHLYEIGGENGLCKFTGNGWEQRRTDIERIIAAYPNVFARG